MGYFYQVKKKWNVILISSVSALSRCLSFGSILILSDDPGFRSHSSTDIPSVDTVIKQQRVLHYYRDCSSNEYYAEG